MAGGAVGSNRSQETVWLHNCARWSELSSRGGGNLRSVGAQRRRQDDAALDRRLPPGADRRRSADVWPTGQPRQSPPAPEIGHCAQELALYDELTARENLSFFGSLYGLAERELEERVDAVLAAMGLTERADGRTDSFSGGMKRRLNLGAALVHRPRLLLLDEPTTGVDPQSRNHIFEEIRRLNSEGLTIVYSSHYMEEVQSLCSRIAIIDHGRLVACDTLNGLLQRLDGLIRFRVAEVSSVLCERLKAMPEARLSRTDGGVLELKCRDVKATLLRLIALLSELQVELMSLELAEPNLERVFLHMTGGRLRD